MKKLLILLLVFIVSGQVNAVDYNEINENWKSRFQTKESPDCPTDSQFCMERIADKYAYVYAKTGQPIAIFDLTMSHLGLKEFLLGSIGINDLSVKGIIKNRVKAKRARKKLLKESNRKQSLPEGFDVSVSDVELNEETRNQFGKGRDVVSDKDLFKTLKMNSNWARRKGVKSTNGESTFKHGDFNLSEVKIESKQKEVVEEGFKNFIEMMYPGSGLSVNEFMSEFEFRFDEEKKSYDLVWNQKARTKQKKIKLPGTVLNFLNPIAAWDFRRKIREYDKYAYYYFGPGVGVIRPGSFRLQFRSAQLLYMVLSRIFDHLMDRLNYHEMQFLALLEGMNDFEYQMNFPVGLVDPAIDLLYFNQTRIPTSLNDGIILRDEWLHTEQKAYSKVMDNLPTLLENSNLTLDQVHSRRFVITRNKEDNTLSGIYGAAVPVTFFKKRIYEHVRADSAALHILERGAIDLAALAAKTLIPSDWYVIVPTNFKYLQQIILGLDMPHDAWEYFIKYRMRQQLMLEAKLKAYVDEALAGRVDLGLSKDELNLVKKRIRQVHFNGYIVRDSKESEAIEKNLAILKQALVGGQANKIFTKENIKVLEL